MDAFYGMIASFGFNFAPYKWAFCSGQVIAISQNTALYSLISSYYGGDGRATFGYPDLRARVPIGSNQMGAAPGLTSFPLGTKLGAQTHTLTLAQMPAHNHAAVFTPSGGSSIVATVEASTDAATKRAPAAGDYIASQPALGSFPNMYVGSGSVGTTVELGGVSVSGGGGTGTVSVDTNGSSHAFDILNPLQAINYCICEDGIYPSRN
ncbi:MAG: tail fiber protein [Alphaproteobacteria bacterium]|nr:tail fiber protein [Alphaproteobacteria bacterium]MBO6865024.1 tail fiber protein [Alphaproteobacteria bacterium]MEC9268267.1 tail fiber protein [Pseudomonadota bacterium]